MQANCRAKVSIIGAYDRTSSNRPLTQYPERGYYPLSIHKMKYLKDRLATAVLISC